MTYTVTILRTAEKELDRLPAPVHNRLVQRILTLETNARPREVKKLSGKEEYRLRVGDYRILYRIDDRERRIDIVAVGHRGEIYR